MKFTITRGVLTSVIESPDETICVIPDEVKTIGNGKDSVFTSRQHESTISEVIIPEGVTKIEKYAFSHMSKLKKVTIPSTVKVIEKWAFESSSIESIVFSGAPIKIGAYAFSFCADLKELVNLSEDVEWGDGVFWGCTSMGTGQAMRVYRDMLLKYEIQDTAPVFPNSIKRICAGSLGTNKIDKLVIPESIEVVEYYNHLSYLDLVIWKRRFKAFSDLQKERIQEEVPVMFALGDEKTECRVVFNDVLMKKTAMLDEKHISWLHYDSLLTTKKAKLKAVPTTLAMACRLRWPVDLADEYADIYRETVKKNIKQVMPYLDLLKEDNMVGFLMKAGLLDESGRVSVKKHEKPVMENTDVKTPTQLRKEWNYKQLEDGSVRLTSYKGADTQIKIPAAIGKYKVSSIGDMCLSADSYYADEEQEKIRRAITSVEVPEGIIEIQDNAFGGDDSLETVRLPESLKKIGSYAFFGCDKIRQLDSSGKIELGEKVFSCCPALEDDHGFYIFQDVLYSYQGDEEHLTIPATVHRIEPNAFSKLNNLKSIVFPEGMTEFSEDTIWNVPNLERLTFPATMATVNFSGLVSDKTIVIRGYSGSVVEEACKDKTDLQFESIGELPKLEFIIQDGVLIEYRGDEKQVQVPDGVTAIRGRKKGYNFVGAFAFNDQIESVILPESVVEIGFRAFQGATSLKTIDIPMTVTLAERSAFEGTPWLHFKKGLVYAGSVLIDCISSKKEIETLEIREGTKRVDKHAFWGKTIKNLLVPSSVTEIQQGSIHGAVTNLNDVAILKCHGGVLHKKSKLPTAFKIFYTGEPEDTAWIVLFQKETPWKNALKKMAELHVEELDQTYRQLSKLILETEAFDKSMAQNAVDYALAYHNLVSSDALKEIYHALEKRFPACLERLNNHSGFMLAMENIREDLSKLHPVEAKVVEKLPKVPSFTKVLDNVSVGVSYKDASGVCAPRVLAYVVYSYINQFRTEDVKSYSTYMNTCPKYDYVLEADEIAETLDRRELVEALMRLGHSFGGAYWIPAARFADEKATVELTGLLKNWSNWGKYGGTGRQTIMIVHGAMELNNTRAAMFYFDRLGWLGKYAARRGMDEETLRDTVLSDFGFDENREITYDLVGNKVIVRMDQDLNLTLFDVNAGKIVKSMPKKAADAEAWEKAKTDFNDLKKNIRKTITNRKHILFQDFLSGREQEAKVWRKVYIENPVLHALAQLVVWEQDHRFFTLDPQGAVLSDGARYSLTESQVLVAHPMNMGDEIEAWQKYFMERNLKQPFEQVWEPVYSENDIQTDRYIGSVLPVFQFVGKEKDGIRVEGLYSYSENFYLKLEDCSLDSKASEYRWIPGYTDQATFTLGRFEYAAFTRRVNHIVYLLDKWTITDRLLKDDVSTISLLASFNEAQILDFIHLVSENGNCPNITAALLEYKQNKYPDTDPMAVFVLE